MKIFKGSSNPKLAKKLARALKIKVAKLELSRFPNSEARVFIKDKINNSTAVVLQSFSIPADEHIIEFCLICDALKRAGAKKIIAVIPWLGYSKQDKVFRDGEPLSVKVIAQIIQTAPFSKLITLDLHNQSIVGFFDKPVIQLTAQPIFLNYFKKMVGKNRSCGPEDFIIIAPDAGSIKSSTAFAGKLNLPVAYVDKERDLSSGKVIIHGISSSISGKKTIIFDDMISTGATLVETSRFLKKNGAKKVFVAATHHLFVRGVQEKLDKSPIDELLITDTIPFSGFPKSKKLKILSVTSLIVKSLKDY